MKIIRMLGFAVLLFGVISAQDNNKSVAVTVYNSNLGVVKEVRTMDIQKGVSQIKIDDVASLIDPTSVHFNLNGYVLEQNYQYDLVGFDKVLQKYIDKDIRLIDEKGGLIEGKLLSSSGGQIVLQTKNSGLILLPNTGKYQFTVDNLPEGLITKPTLVWLIDSKSAGKQKVDISYQTKGMNWSAEYVAVLNEKDTKLDLTSWVSVTNNAGASFKDAKLKLVAGDINLVSDKYPNPVMKSQFMVESASDRGAEQFQEKEFFEYHIYNLDRPTNLLNNETKQILLFEAKDVNVTKKYLYKSSEYYDNNKVKVIVEFKNTEENKLGKPMPKGKFRVYKSDGDAIEFIGEDQIDHTTKKETVKLKIGEAFDIVTEETQTDNKQITKFVTEQTWTLKIKNRKKEDVVVDVERTLYGNWQILNSSLNFEKVNAYKVLFKVPVKADSETVLTYTIRYNH